MRPEDILSLYTHNSLRTMARVREYPLGTLRRPELITALAERLLLAAELERMVGALVEGERAALNAVVQSGGRVGRQQFAEMLLDAGIIDEVGPTRPRETIDRIAPTTRRFEELCARLTARGLLFSEPHIEGTLAGLYDLGPGAVLFLPGPVLETLRLFVSKANNSQTLEARREEPVLQEPAEQIVRGRLIVQPSYSILLLPPLDTPTLDFLSATTEIVHRAEVAEFKLTQEALYTAVERGVNVSEVIEFLEARSEQPLPQNVRYTLEGWARTFAQLRVLRRGAVIQAASETLDWLVARPELTPLVVRRPRPDLLVVSDTTAVERALAAIGELPQVTDYAETERPQLQISAEGVVSIDAEMNHLLLPLALRRIAEPINDGQFQLTRDRVRAAVAAAPDGLTGLIKWLRAHAIDVPSALVARLKLWTIPSAEVALDQPLLLRVPHDLLPELRALPELSPLLADEYRPDAALIRISPEHKLQLLAALRARGLDLPEQTDER